MDNIRIFLLSSLAFVGFLLWQNWESDYNKPTELPAVTQSAQPMPTTPPLQPGTVAQQPSANAVATAPAVAEKRIRVITDRIVAEISTAGGEIKHLELSRYPTKVEDPTQAYRLLSDRAGKLFVVQSGFVAVQGNAPDHRAMYQADASEYRLAEGQDRLVVPLRWQDANGVVVTKQYVFHRGQYQVDVSMAVENKGSQSWQGRQYQQLQRQAQEQKSSFFGVHSYSGATYYDGKYHKLAYDDFAEEPLSAQITGGWTAFVDHYFMAAVIPNAPEENHYYSKVLADSAYLVGFVGPTITVAPGSKTDLASRLFLGPKEQKYLADIAPGLELNIDYGILTIVAEPIFTLLSWFHALVGNWGVSIILLTTLIRALFYKLGEAQYKSMARMREFAPRIQALRDRFADDKQKLNEAMMDLYRKEKFNPFGGCWPLIVQMPVFISLYWVLLESVELRQAPFALWILDLSAADPYYVLPVLFGLTMFVQQKMSVTPAMDPTQRQVMMIMPVMMTAMFALFPSGLVLYWFTNNLLSLAQQWYITRKFDETKQQKGAKTA